MKIHARSLLAVFIDGLRACLPERRVRVVCPACHCTHKEDR